ncbi:hypothetical protein PENSPDRAFT_477396 [Peniophora sp. CONT]|nr:hypothetical protein PENSPDRAFT_477396 [Peniophora sp. CONT]
MNPVRRRNGNWTSLPRSRIAHRCKLTPIHQCPETLVHAAPKVSYPHIRVVLSSARLLLSRFRNARPLHYYHRSRQWPIKADELLDPTLTISKYPIQPTNLLLIQPSSSILFNMFSSKFIVFVTLAIAGSSVDATPTPYVLLHPLYNVHS